MEGGGVVSATPAGWRERRFVVVIWIDLGAYIVLRNLNSEEWDFIHPYTKKRDVAM